MTTTFDQGDDLPPFTATEQQTWSMTMLTDLVIERYDEHKLFKRNEKQNSKHVRVERAVWVMVKLWSIGPVKEADLIVDYGTAVQETLRHLSQAGLVERTDSGWKLQRLPRLSR